MNGRATDAQFAQNPLPIARAMGEALGRFHGAPIPDGLGDRTGAEVDLALRTIRSGALPPEPFSRIRHETLIDVLSERPTTGQPVVTHGAPIVGSVVLVDGVATFEGDQTLGLDPAERDLAIAIRSIAETFTSEVAATFLEGYVDVGGALPHGPALDWYGVVAAFR